MPEPILTPGAHLYAAYVHLAGDANPDPRHPYTWVTDPALKQLRDAVKAVGVGLSWRHLHAYPDGLVTAEYIKSNGVTMASLSPQDLMELLILLQIPYEWRTVENLGRRPCLATPEGGETC